MQVVSWHTMIPTDNSQLATYSVVVGAVGYGVVAFAGLNLLAGLAGDVEIAEGAVGLEVEDRKSVV